MGLLQFSLSLVIAVVGTVVPLWLGTYTYTFATDVAPYKDTGFDVAPNWSNTALPNHIYAGVHAGLVMLFCLVSSERVTMLRRLLFLWGIAQIVQLAQTLSTRFPDPNIRLRNRDWDYTMYEVQYVVGALMVQFYSARTWLRMVSWCVTVFGLMLLIPTRALYTVDMICGLFSGVGVFLLYHWYVRTTVTIKKRRFLKWFEEESIELRDGDVNTPHAENGDFVYDRVDDPKSDFHLEHFRHPTLEPQERQDHVTELVNFASGLPERWKQFYPLVSAVVGGAFGGGLGMLNLISMSTADATRPLHIPLPEDIGYKLLPQVPDHTADVLLYTQVITVLLFGLASKWRFTILKRTGITYGLIMIWRCFTVPATFPPDPSPVCKERWHPAGTTCGDLIFSGHTVAFLLSALVVRKYTRPMWLEAGAWAFTACGLLAVITSRLHYTRDVVTAVLVITTVYHLVDKAIFDRPDRAARNLFFKYLELDYYIVLEEEIAAEREGRISRHNLIGRFWKWVRSEGDDSSQHHDSASANSLAESKPILGA